MAMALGTPGLSPALWGQGLVSLGHPSPLCFAQKQVVGIVVDSSALRKEPPPDVNQGQGEERGEERRGQERREKEKDGTRWMVCSRWPIHLELVKKVGWPDDST